MTIERYIQLGIAVLLAVVGSVLLLSGFWVEPQGEISDSVLIGYGEIMSFVSGILGIDYLYDYKRRKYEKDLISDLKRERESDKKINVC